MRGMDTRGKGASLGRNKVESKTGTDGTETLTDNGKVPHRLWKVRNRRKEARRRGEGKRKPPVKTKRVDGKKGRKGKEGFAEKFAKKGPVADERGIRKTEKGRLGRNSGCIKGRGRRAWRKREPKKNRDTEKSGTKNHEEDPALKIPNGDQRGRGEKSSKKTTMKRHPDQF